MLIKYLEFYEAVVSGAEEEVVEEEDDAPLLPLTRADNVSTLKALLEKVLIKCLAITKENARVA